MWFKDLFFIIWAYFPFFSITDDAGFLAPSKEQTHKYYLNLINILFGEIKIQIISIPLGQNVNVK
jgi:hypothetical protein